MSLNRTMTRGIVACLVAGAGLVAVEMSPLNNAHGTHWWHHLPAFDIAYGLVGSVVIVVVSKVIGSVWLQRRDTYYEDGDG